MWVMINPLLTERQSDSERDGVQRMNGETEKGDNGKEERGEWG